jgi:hypothetical protein
LVGDNGLAIASGGGGAKQQRGYRYTRTDYAAFQQASHEHSHFVTFLLIVFRRPISRTAESQRGLPWCHSPEAFVITGGNVRRLHPLFYNESRRTLRHTLTHMRKDVLEYLLAPGAEP